MTPDELSKNHIKQGVANNEHRQIRGREYKNELVSAQVAQYGRIAITAEVMVNQLGVQAEQDAISIAHEHHPTHPHIPSSPNPPDAPSSPSLFEPSFSITDEPDQFWNPISTSHFNLISTPNPFLSPSTLIYPNDSLLSNETFDSINPSILNSFETDLKAPIELNSSSRSNRLISLTDSFHQEERKENEGSKGLRKERV
ncbi:hypothetical protein DFH28DRAFT_1217461 [Melampsora americana]|nr:hypothetical protein DFH28DRAFT_1217461 [Melampsora americana]